MPGIRWLLAMGLLGVSSHAAASLYVSTDVPKAISDTIYTTVTSTISVTDYRTITDVNASLSLTHPNDQDLDIYLQSPLGTLIELTTDNGGVGDNYISTVFDDAAATSITAGTAPFTGTFRPEGQLLNLNGQDAFGIWTLRITVDSWSSPGTLTGWSLDIAGQPTPVPLPAAAWLLLSGLGGLGLAGRRKNVTMRPAAFLPTRTACHAARQLSGRR